MIKKIIFILLLGFYVVSINASTYKYTEWTTDYPEGVNEKYIESEVRYKWYKEIETNIEYLPKESFNNKLYDLSDFMYTDYGEESLTIPEEKEDREVITNVEGISYSYGDVDHILISNITGAKTYFIEIDVFNNKTGESINYIFENIYNDIYDLSKLNDDNYDEFTKIDSTVIMLLNLGEKYDVRDLAIKLYYQNASFLSETIDVSFTNGIDNKLFSGTTNYVYCLTCSTYLYYNNTYISNINQEVTTYKYRDKLYKTYNIEKEYSSEYLVDLDGYIKDENDFVTYYRYIDDCYVLFDIHGNMVNDENYCNKNFCYAVYVKKKTSLLQQLMLLIQRRMMRFINI